MPVKGTNPTQRIADPTVKDVQFSGTGNSTSRRRNIPVEGVTIAIPAKVRLATFRNGNPAGTGNDIRLRINASGGNFITLRPGDPWTPPIPVKGTILDATGVGGSAPLDCIFSG